MGKTAADFWKFAGSLSGSMTLEDAFTTWAEKNKITIKEGAVVWKTIATSLNSLLSTKIAAEVQVEVKDVDGKTVKYTGLPADVKTIAPKDVAEGGEEQLGSPELLGGGSAEALGTQPAEGTASGLIPQGGDVNIEPEAGEALSDVADIPAAESVEPAEETEELLSLQNK